MLDGKYTCMYWRRMEIYLERLFNAIWMCAAKELIDEGRADRKMIEVPPDLLPPQVDKLIDSRVSRFNALDATDIAERNPD